MKNGDMLLMVAVSYGLLFIAAVTIVLILQRGSKKWKIIAEGIYDHVSYGYYNEMDREGVMVHRDVIHKMEVTVAHLSDRRTYEMDGRHDITFPRGTQVQILENGPGDRKIQRLESQQ